MRLPKYFNVKVDKRHTRGKNMFENITTFVKT